MIAVGVIADLRRDVAYLMRLVGRFRTTVLTAVSGVALALALAGGVLAAVSPTLFPRFGIADPASLVYVRSPHGLNGWTYDEFRAFTAEAGDLPVGAHLYAASTELRDAGDVVRRSVNPAFVSGRFFEVVGARPRLGRLLGLEDDRPGRQAVAVLSYDAWERLFGRDPSILGTPLWIGDRRVNVVGVVEPRFTGPSAVRAPAVWLPLEELVSSRQQGAKGLWPQVLARAATAAEKERLLSRIRSVSQAGGFDAGDRSGTVVVTPMGGAVSVETSRSPSLQPLERPRIDAHPAMRLLLLLVIALVLMAIATFGSAMLSVATARERELATRLAVGASRRRVILQLLTESVVLGAGGAVVCAFALYAALPFFADVFNLPLGLHVRSDGRLYGAMIAASALVGICGGLSPVIYLVKLPVRNALAGTGALYLRPQRLRGTIIGVQITLSVVCLVTAATLMRGAAQARAIQVGMDLDALLALQGTQIGLTWTPEEAAAYWDAALPLVERTPGVAATAFTTKVFGGGSSRQGIQVNGVAYQVVINKTSSAWFAVAGVPVLRGRAYTDAEGRAGAPVAVISLGLARALDGLDRSLGSKIRFISSPGPDLTVIGVAGDVVGAVASLSELSRPLAGLYQPLGWDDLPRAALIVRASGNRAALKRDLERVLPSFLPDRPPSPVQIGAGLSKQIEEAQQPARLASLAGIALVVLTGVGLHGLISLNVHLRARDLSVRSTLGAGPFRLALAAVRPALLPTLGGVAAGCLAAVVLLRRFAPALYGVPVFDPLSWSAAAAVLVLGLGVGVWHPLARLRRIQPAAVLRGE